ncbi:hypothetical protein QYF36_009551 [Acer negundo]|nr:hypothetical protein QYF36_009551 [Acer negundo]
MYGNYDGLSKLLRFDLLLGADLWDSVELANASTIVTKEILHVPQTNHVYVCLLDSGLGTPFMHVFIRIMALEKFLNQDHYFFI